jgi:hypothetical protein
MTSLVLGCGSVVTAPLPSAGLVGLAAPGSSTVGLVGPAAPVVGLGLPAAPVVGLVAPAAGSAVLAIPPPSPAGPIPVSAALTVTPSIAVSAGLVTPGPAFDAVGTSGTWEWASTSGTIELTASITPSAGAYVLGWVSLYGYPDVISSVMLNGSAMPQLGVAYLDGDPSTSFSYLYAYGQSGVSGGQTVTVTFPSDSTGDSGAYGVNVNLVSYMNVSSAVWAAPSDGNSTALTQTVAAASGNVVAQAFCGWDNLSGYSQTQRSYVGYGPDFEALPLLIGDAPGVGSVVFGATGDGSYAPNDLWAAAAVVLS